MPPKRHRDGAAAEGASAAPAAKRDGSGRSRAVSKNVLPKCSVCARGTRETAAFSTCPCFKGTTRMCWDCFEAQLSDVGNVCPSCDETIDVVKRMAYQNRRWAPVSEYQLVEKGSAAPDTTDLSGGADELVDHEPEKMTAEDLEFLADDDNTDDYDEAMRQLHVLTDVFRHGVVAGRIAGRKMPTAALADDGDGTTS